MERVQLNMDALEMVNGGRCFMNGNPTLHIHKNCGGIIDNCLLTYAKCRKCGEKHWWLSDFTYSNIRFLDWKKQQNNQ